MSVMCLSDGSHWPATAAEYQKKEQIQVANVNTLFLFLFLAEAKIKDIFLKVNVTVTFSSQLEVGSHQRFSLVLLVSKDEI